MRLRVARIVAIVSALGWLVLPGFGLIDLAVTWSPDWPQVLEAGWGLFFTVIVAGPFLLVAAAPGRLAVALAQLGIAAATLVVAAVLTSEPRLAALAGLIVVEAAIVGWLARGGLSRSADAPPIVRVRWSMPLLAIVLIGAIPWLAYAWRMIGLDRMDAPVDLTLGIDHDAVQGALGLALVALGLLAAAWPVGRWVLALSVGITAAYLGIVSFGWPGATGGVDQWWSMAAVVWGAAVILAGWPEGRRVDLPDGATERATFPAGR